MKKRKNLFLIIFFVSTGIAISQNIKGIVVDYDEIYKTGLHKGELYTESILLHNVNESVYKVGGKLLESKVKDDVVTETKEKKSIPLQFYFKNYKSDKIIKQFGEENSLSIIYKSKSFKWELLKDTKTISGVTCKKAISKTDAGIIVAWYSEEAGIIGGPRQYDGLPGLIIYLENDYFIYKVKKISKKTEKNNLPLKDHQTKFVTEEMLKKGITTTTTKVTNTEH